MKFRRALYLAAILLVAIPAAAGASTIPVGKKSIAAPRLRVRLLNHSLTVAANEEWQWTPEFSIPPSIYNTALIQPTLPSRHPAWIAWDDALQGFYGEIEKPGVYRATIDAGTYVLPTPRSLRTRWETFPPVEVTVHVAASLRQPTFALPTATVLSTPLDSTPTFTSAVANNILANDLEGDCTDAAIGHAIAAQLAALGEPSGVTERRVLDLAESANGGGGISAWVGSAVDAALLQANTDPVGSAVSRIVSAAALPIASMAPQQWAWMVAVTGGGVIATIDTSGYLSLWEQVPQPFAGRDAAHLELPTPPDADEETHEVEVAGVSAAGLVLDSWGTRYEVSWSWVSANVVDATALLTQGLAETGLDGVSGTALEGALGGRLGMPQIQAASSATLVAGPLTTLATITGAPATIISASGLPGATVSQAGDTEWVVSWDGSPGSTASPGTYSLNVIASDNFGSATRSTAVTVDSPRALFPDLPGFPPAA